jgi:hypothetical protein
MTTMLANWFLFQVAGIWPLIWHFGLGGVLVLICAAGWYFSPVHKVDFIWGAVIVIVVMVSTAIGVNLGEKRVRAQWDAASFATLQNGKQARVDGVSDAARKPSRWLPHRQDRYDRDGR